MLRNLKSQLRKQIGAELAKLTVEEVQLQSEQVFEKVVSSEWYQECQRISIYVSTTNEIQTDRIIRDALRKGKQVFIPLFAKGNDTMDMVRLASETDFDSLPTTLWGIRQPKQDCNWEKYQKSGPLDVVICPGVAFSPNRCRLGHGKGYYDKMLAGHWDSFEKLPYRAALVLKEQMIGSVPVNGKDVIMDELVLP